MADKHLIIGKGNLGLDLKAELEATGAWVEMITASEGFEWPESRPLIDKMMPDCVWITAGFGSVGEAENICEMDKVLNTHFELPLGLALWLPKQTKLAIFSSDYVASESEPKSAAKHTQRPLSIYSSIKIAMELAIQATKRPLTTVFRVGSLYGGHFPERGLPGKLRNSFPEPCELELPNNWVCPTPTWWIAKHLVDGYLKPNSMFNSRAPMRHHIAPIGGLTVHQWGKLILGDKYTVHCRGGDPKRPSFSGLGLSFGSDESTWEQLWKEHNRMFPQPNQLHEMIIPSSSSNALDLFDHGILHRNRNPRR